MRRKNDKKTVIVAGNTQFLADDVLEIVMYPPTWFNQSRVLAVAPDGTETELDTTPLLVPPLQQALTLAKTETLAKNRASTSIVIQPVYGTGGKALSGKLQNIFKETGDFPDCILYYGQWLAHSGFSLTSTQ